MTITARKIIDLLESRHSKDVFVRECKTGETWRGGHLRLDGWAMKRSWANPAVFGYEVKVARSDFLSDEKWTSYLDYCDRFSFVCTYGLISPEEIPQDVGLIWASKNGTRLYTKRKAVPRNVSIPESLWRYILMSRVRVTERDIDLERDSSTDYWRWWLGQKREKRELGGRVRYEIARMIGDAESKLRQAEAIRDKTRERSELIERLAEGLGIRGWDWSERRVTEALLSTKTGIPVSLGRELKSLRSSIDDLLKTLDLNRD